MTGDRRGGGLRLMSVHAHADDESITMGRTLAVLAARGVGLCNVCCTDGELASIVATDMPEETTRPRLGAIRREELRGACAALGVERVEFLGYHDSGMAGSATARRAEAFAMQPVGDAAERICALVRDFRPHVVVTYDAYGGYGHPDHIQTHRATLVAVEAAHHGAVFPGAGPPWRVSKLYYTAFPKSTLQRMIDLALAAGMPHPFDGRGVDELEFATPDELATTTVDAGAGVAAQRAALRAHHSQIDESFGLLTVPEEVLRDVFGAEHYQLAMSRVPVELPETDLFAGVEPDRAVEGGVAPAATLP
ncbi:MAG TPA: PIG-L family deacetylase [Candidatus Dormibacteraeota bacterium]|nr:PIG-L family deacetylase [Candidatus Dormibacteraeota bacterium]